MASVFNSVCLVLCIITCMCPFLPPSSLDTAADVAVTSPAPASFRFLTPRGHGAQRWSASPSPQVTRTRRNLVPRAPDAAVPNQAPSTKPEFILGRPRPFSTRVPGAQIHIYCRVKPKSRGLFREIPLIYAPARLIGLDVSRGHACASLSPPFTPWDHQLWPGFATRGRPRALPLIAWYGGGSQLPRAGQLPAGQLSSSAYAGQADVRCVVPVTRGLRMHGYRARAQALCPVPALVEGETQWCAYAPDDPAPRRQARPREVACPQLVLAGGASSTLEYEARGGHWSGIEQLCLVNGSSREGSKRSREGILSTLKIYPWMLWVQSMTPPSLQDLRLQVPPVMQSTAAYYQRKRRRLNIARVGSGCYPGRAQGQWGEFALAVLL
ncbi:hypothetical protein DFH09DRAFT_1078786 [Mycena vulgaris]|nr:hypothetical protein DFH09DRAFT_1078786 [Mycena vulgaris]